MEVGGQLHTPATLALGKEPTAPTEYETGWALEPVLMLWRREKSCPCQKLKPSQPIHSLLLYLLTEVSWHPQKNKTLVIIHFNFKHILTNL
jgi:hypothetical protein